MGRGLGGHVMYQEEGVRASPVQSIPRYADKVSCHSGAREHQVLIRLPGATTTLGIILYVTAGAVEWDLRKVRCTTMGRATE